MENGGGNLAYKFSALALSGNSNDDSNSINNNNKDGLFQVMKAVEAAEATIKQQVEENNRLRSELQKKIHELEIYKSDDSRARSPHSVEHREDHVVGPQKAHQSVSSSLENRTDEVRRVDNFSAHDPSGTPGLRKDLIQNSDDPRMQTRGQGGHSSETSKTNGTLEALPGSQAVAAAETAGFSQLSSPSTTSFSPSSYQIEGEYDPQFNLSGQGLMPMAEVNNPLKQDLVVKIREHEQEILQLRKHLSEYLIKEAQIRNDKFVLEKRIAYMRMAFDQQQQDLVDAASKALSYRQDIIEENIRLTYALQDAQQERSTFVSSLMPVLAEYSLQPPVADAQSIVSNLKVLFKHLQEKLIVTEAKLKESQYQLAPWRSDVNLSNFGQSPSHSTGNKNGLELVAQPAYSDGQLPMSSDPLTTRDWDLLGHHQSSLGGGVARGLEPDDMGGMYSPLSSRNNAAQDTHGQLAISQGGSHPMRNSESTSSKQVTFNVPVTSSEMDDPEMEGRQMEREPSVPWGSKNSPYTTLDDPGSSYSPYLPPVLEEPSSSFSEAADDDPLPAVEGLQISGEPYPGRELQASGYSINGTTSCNFEWVRHLEDGSVKYIDGAKQPSYLVSADDVDTYLAIEVQPMDDRKRKGELVKVFANENRKITCDLELHTHIQRNLSNGHATYRVTLSTRYLELWEPATLAIKREGYSIKCSGPSAAIVTEKFSPSTIVTLTCGNPTEFSIIGTGNVEHLLRAAENLQDISCSRDAIVLTMRFFVMRAGEKKKGKRKGLFFNK
ncbi:hypothetical protein LguiB_016968 [Lonicera macranthoides]